jgi:hypothetical protein
MAGMTTTYLSARTRNQVLRLEIDLGNMPSWRNFSGAVNDLSMTVSYCESVLSRFEIKANPGTMGSPYLRRGEIQLVRTSLASPWITILADAAQRSAPVGYSISAIFCLQKLLRMVMEWQRHRIEIEERRIESRINLITQFNNEITDEFRREGLVRRSDPATDSERQSDDLHAQSIEHFPKINSVEMVDEDRSFD